MPFCGAGRENAPEHGKLASAIHATQLAQRECRTELQGACILVYAIERFCRFDGHIQCASSKSETLRTSTRRNVWCR